MELDCPATTTCQATVRLERGKGKRGRGERGKGEGGKGKEEWVDLEFDRIDSL